MQIAGGKSRLGKRIGALITTLRGERYPLPYWEPFVGAANVTRYVEGGQVKASDANKYLIAMWKALQDGWVPPEEVPDDEYVRARDLTYRVPDHLRAFVMFGCSWGGKWGGGYARYSNGRNYIGEASRSALRKVEDLRGVVFEHADYREVEPRGGVVYADPPYEGSTGGEFGTPPLDHDEFWLVAHDWAVRDDNVVLVSSAVAPQALFTPVVEFNVGVSKGCTLRESTTSLGAELGIEADSIECSLVSARERLFVAREQAEWVGWALRDAVENMKGARLLVP